jgi:putative hydrolase of the HAD superfamily
MYFFDLDDTLLAETQSSQKALSHLCNITGIEIGWETWNRQMKAYFQLYLDGKISFEQQRIERIKSTFNTKFSESEARALFANYLKVYEESWSLYDDAKEILSQIGSGFGIITNGESAQQRRKIERLGLHAFNPRIYISSEVGYSKPDFRIFKYAMHDSGVLPSQCVFVGDNYKNDIIPAVKLGMKAIHVSRNGEIFPESVQSLCQVQGLA